MNSFDTIAAYYDLEHEGLIFDITMYLGILETGIDRHELRTPGPDARAKSALVLGVGTGRVAMGLADAGLTVWGIDNSPGMLAVAREKLSIRPEVRLIDADIRDFDLDRMFDLVIVPFDTFSLLDDANAQLKTLEGCRRHLAAGGRVVIDVVNPLTLPEVEQNGLMHPRFEAAVGGRRISARQRAEVDPATQTMRLTIEYRESDSGADRSLEVQVNIRWAYRYELEAIMRLAGLAVDDVWGDYDLGDYDVDSSRLIIAGRHADPPSSR